MPRIVYGPNYHKARREAFARSDGQCQFCGIYPIVDSHHWALVYPSDSEVTPDDLTGLCRICHTVATELRRFHRAGGTIFNFKKALLEALERCATESPLKGSALSSSTTERPDSINAPLPIKKRQKSRARKAATEPRPTIDDSASLSAKQQFPPVLQILVSSVFQGY